MEEAKRQGCRVFLLTSLSLQDTAEWPSESLEDIFYMRDEAHEWNTQHMLLAVSHLCRTTQVDRIVPLDDFDLEKAALLREHLRLPGLGETATRYFRDKLAMRMRAAENGIPVPEFTPVFNYQEITQFVDTVAPPWVLKPRLMAGAVGIKKFDERQDVWGGIHSLGDQQSFFILERFLPGDIYHVDSIWHRGNMVYAISSAYGTPPLEITTSGGIFTTRILERGSETDRALRTMNEKVLRTFQLTNGVSHTEFIRSRDDGAFYFLETSARVGGAHISDLIEAATGVNLWEEWAKIEIAAALGTGYAPPPENTDYAGLLVSLARQEWPDTSGFQEPELVWRMRRRHHVGFIVKSPYRDRVEDLLALYTERVHAQFHASAPPREKAND